MSVLSPVSVAVCLDTRYAPARMRALGISDYGQRKNWRLTLFNAEDQAAVLALKGWKGHGVLSFLSGSILSRYLKKRGLPHVNTGSCISKGTPVVALDDAALGRMVAEHLVEAGRRSYGFCGFAGNVASNHRKQCILEAIRRLVPHALLSEFDFTAAEPFEEVTAAARWLSGRTLPLALAAHDDRAAFVMLQACQVAGLTVPGQVAVLGAGDDPVLTEMAAPPLSSVAVPALRIGYLAAELLDRIIAGETPPETGVFLPPSGIHARRSTRQEGSADPLVQKAIDLVRETYGQINAAELASRCGVSRRTLERRMSAGLGLSAGDLALRVRMENASRLLRLTSATLEDIAQQCGYASSSSFSRAFASQHRQTPGEYRTANRMPSGA